MCLAVLCRPVLHTGVPRKPWPCATLKSLSRLSVPYCSELHHKDVTHDIVLTVHDMHSSYQLWQRLAVQRSIVMYILAVYFLPSE